MKKQYKIIRLPKGKGAFRTIYAPSKDYKLKLKSLLLDLQQKLHNADSDYTVQGFMRGRNPATNARKHIGYRYTLSLDIKDFFDSVKVEMASKYLSDEEREHCFIDGVARQGLPTSPVIANLAFLSLDHAIKEAISEVGAYVVYTRYADDMFFSFNNRELSEELESLVKGVVESGGFELNTAKSKLQSSKAGRRIITGISVGERDIAPTRRLKRRIRAAIHQQNRAKAFGLLSWAELKEPRAFYTDRDLLNKNIFQDEALDISNDFYLSDLLSFDAYVEAVEKDFDSQFFTHEIDPGKWKQRKEAFLEQREAFYQQEKEKVVKERKTTRKDIERQLADAQTAKEKPKKAERVAGSKPMKSAFTPPKSSVAEVSKSQEPKELVVDLDTLKEIEQVEASKFQEEKKKRRQQKEVIERETEEKEEVKRSLNNIFMMAIGVIIVIIAAMSYYFSNSEVEIKPEYPLFVKVTPYDARVQILNIKPKYTMGIMLKPGKYDIRISKKGYKSQRFWITMEHEPVVVERELKKIKKRKVY